MNYVEQRDFTLRFELRCEFPEDYDGDADGFEWVKDFPAIAAEILGQRDRDHPASVPAGTCARQTEDVPPTKRSRSW